MAIASTITTKTKLLTIVAGPWRRIACSRASKIAGRIGLVVRGRATAFGSVIHRMGYPLAIA